MTAGQTDQAAAAGTRPGSGWIADALREHDHAERPENPDGRPSLPVTDREQQVLDRIDRARRRRPRVREERITMSHGAGGKATQTLIEAVFLDAFRNPLLEPLEDAAELRVPVSGGAPPAGWPAPASRSPPTPTSCPRCSSPAATSATWRSTARSTTCPYPGATPMYLTAGFILEEGFPVADLTRIAASMRDAAAAAGVCIVTGDTKVVERGKADGCYINTAGVGVISGDASLGVASARPGDAIIVSGPIGDHGITIMLARGELDIEADVVSDTAPLNGLVAGAARRGPRGARDARRDQGRRGDHTQRDRAGRRRGRAGQRGRHPRAARGARCLRAARHRPDVRRVRGPPRRRRARRQRRRGGARAPRPPAGRAGGGHRRRSSPTSRASSG